MITDEEEFDFGTMETPDRAGTCANCGKVESVVQTNIDGDNLDGLLCYDCAGELGYCFGCGVHADGTEAYEINEIGHYCENCQDQIRDTCDPDGSDDDEWDGPYLHYIDFDQP